MNRSVPGGRRLPRRTVLLAATALATAACGRQDDDAPADEAKAASPLLRVPPSKRRRAPDVRGESLTGEAIALADYRGKVVVINVWGSWCAPCRSEAPNLQKVHEDTRERGVVFLGINTREASRTNARSFERTYGVTYPSLWDPAGREIARFRGTISPSVIPSTIVIDRRGRIAARALKPVSEEELRGLVDPVIEEA